MSGEWWAFIFLILILKIPVIYLGIVVWYACKPPLPPEGAARLAELPEPPHGWRPWGLRRLRPNPGPHGAPARRAPRAPSAARAYAKHE
jgi:hypothetical protein